MFNIAQFGKFDLPPLIKAMKLTARGGKHAACPAAGKSCRACGLASRVPVL
jgi:hypothetical protein